jgi:hypothetical protein
MMELFALAGFGTEAVSASSTLMSTTSAMTSQDCGPFGQSCGQHSALQVIPSTVCSLNSLTGCIQNILSLKLLVLETSEPEK